MYLPFGKPVYVSIFLPGSNFIVAKLTKKGRLLTISEPFYIHYFHYLTIFSTLPPAYLQFTPFLRIFVFMTATDLALLTISELGFEPLASQTLAINMLSAFVVGHLPDDVFILNGYAGTGKTSVVGALVRALTHSKINTVILAPTGRAAKVAGQTAGCRASTIHRRIYHPVGSGPSTKIELSPNHAKDTVFIVDEASLITDTRDNRSVLAHLVRHVYASGERCAMILVGDRAQLPPVGQDNSPAMNHDRLRELGLNPVEATLGVTVRQAAESGILHNATIVRQAITSYKSGPSSPKPAADIFNSPVFKQMGKLPPLPGIAAEPPAINIPQLELRGFDDIRAIPSTELADYLSSSWASAGEEETLIITRSNIRANRYNMHIRNMVMYAEEPLQQGDRLVICKNDYFWKARNSQQGFISNGETAIVKWVGRTEKMYGRFFTETELFFPGDGSTIGAMLMLRSLMAEGPSIPHSEMERFFQIVCNEQEGGTHEKIMAAANDPYYNALQAKYAYCVTCHKAQGGQWRHVYIDMGGIAPEAMDISFLRWLYTAMTRATERLYLINPTLKTDL